MQPNGHLTSSRGTGLSVGSPALCVDVLWLRLPASPRTLRSPAWRSPAQRLILSVIFSRPTLLVPGEKLPLDCHCICVWSPPATCVCRRVCVEGETVGRGVRGVCALQFYAEETVIA